MVCVCVLSRPERCVGVYFQGGYLGEIKEKGLGDLLWFKLQDDQNPDPVTPKDFRYERVESKKWIFSFKYLDPCCEFLEIGKDQC